MVHPSEILRSDSQEGSYFSAPTNAIPERPIDCGISSLPCCNIWTKLEKCAKPSVFLIVLSILGLFQGAVLTYFQGTANSWMQHYNFSPTTVDWLLYFNDIFIGLLAFVVGYWGNRIHRASWIGGLAIFQALACVLLTIPEFHRKNLNVANSTNEIPLCTRNQPRIGEVEPRELNYVAIVVMYVYQIFYAMSMVSFYVHGMTYLDDNINKKHSAGYLCVALASFQIGKQIGMYMGWITFEHFLPNVFLTPMWLIFGACIFMIGVVITTFPYALPHVVQRKMVASILVLAQGEVEEEIKQYSEGFWTTLMRLIRNKVLMANVYASLFMNAALVNFNILQNDYYKSRFFVFVSSDRSGYQDPWLAQIVTNLMKQPFVSLSLISTGMAISKFRPSARNVAIFNLVVAIIATILFGIYGFLQCEDKIESESIDKLSLSFCHYDCNCKQDTPFSPVCTINSSKTYFSPCHAGCTRIEEFGDQKIFRDCTCGDDLHVRINTSAKTGSCNANSCAFFWGLAQVNGITIAALIAATMVTNLMINLRCVYNMDKAMSLSLEATIIGILPYIPLRLIYVAFEDYFCIFKNPDGTCKLHSSNLGTFVTAMTVGLMTISIALTALVVYLIKDLNLYVEAKSGDSRLSPLHMVDHSKSSGDANSSSSQRGRTVPDHQIPTSDEEDNYESSNPSDQDDEDEGYSAGFHNNDLDFRVRQPTDQKTKREEKFMESEF